MSNETTDQVCCISCDLTASREESTMYPIAPSLALALNMKDATPCIALGYPLTLDECKKANLKPKSPLMLCGAYSLDDQGEYLNFTYQLCRTCAKNRVPFLVTLDN